MATGVSDPLWGQHKVSAAEAKEHEDLISAKRIVEIPSNMQMRVDYGSRTDGQPEYQGWAPRGLASSASGWLLHKFTYTGVFMTLRQVGYGTWDGRAAVSYA